LEEEEQEEVGALEEEEEEGWANASDDLPPESAFPSKQKKASGDPKKD
jgi:hypothetical protein